jgi:hypothetical protein
MSDVRGGATLDEKLDLWLIGGAERFRRDPQLRKALLAIARHEDSRGCLQLLESILETPRLAERLIELLKPEARKEAAAPGKLAVVNAAARRVAGRAPAVSANGRKAGVKSARKGGAL